MFYVLDIKGKDFTRWPGQAHSDEPPPVSRLIGRVQVWSPELASPEGKERWQWGIKRQAIEKNQAAVILYDELAALIYKKGDFSEEYRRIQKVGGGLGLTTLSLTQELGGIPPTAYGQAQHFLVWHLQTVYDRTVATGMLEQTPKWGPRYSFWYRNLDSDYPALLYSDIQEFL